MIRGGYGIYYGTATGQPPLFTLRYVQQIAMTVTNDGRADFAVNPFNGPAPTYDQAKALLCAFQPNPASPTCNLRHSTSNFAAPDLVDPVQPPGVARLRSVRSARRCRSRRTGSTPATATQLTTRNINVAYNPATGAPYPFAGAQAAANYVNRPYPGWGTIQLNRQRRRAELPRAADGVHQADGESLAGVGHLHAVAHATQFDQLPLNPGCQYPVTIVAGSRRGRATCRSRCAPDVSENAWYATGAQRNRVTFNGIWEAPYGFQLSGLYIFGDNG